MHFKGVVVRPSRIVVDRVVQKKNKVSRVVKSEDVPYVQGVLTHCCV